MAIRGLGQALGIIGQGMQQKAQLDWQEQRQANLERIRQEERGQDKSERDAERKQRGEERLIDIAARNEDRKADNQYRADSLAANDRSDKARINIAQAGLDEQRKDSIFQKEAALMAQALKPHNDIMSAIQSVSASQPTYTADGNIKGYANEEDFNKAKGRQLESLTKKMNEMKPKIQESVREAYSRISPENRKWFDGLEKQLEAPTQKTETPEQKAEAERKAFLTSPEEVAKRKAAQAAADAGAAQPKQPLVNLAAGVPVKIRGVVTDPEPSPRNPQAWRKWRDRKDALELKASSLLQRPVMPSGRGGI
jgi:hypothetical protein